MGNLLKETRAILKANDKKFSDIAWVGCEKFKIPVEEFKRLADKEYDSGYGSAKVAQDLLVVGKDFWLERHEYDGSEWWEYKELPKEPDEIRCVDRVLGGMWNSLEELNEKKGK